MSTVLERAEEHPIVLFDGVCNFCQGVVRFALARDRAARFRFAPLQSDLGRALLAGHGLDADALDTFVVVDQAGAHARSDAVLRLALGLGAPWAWLWPLRAVPKRVRDWLYDRIARSRYRWFGRLEACPTPPPGWRDRFLV